MQKFESLILSVPHASVDFPTWDRSGWEECDRMRLKRAVYGLADVKTDCLFRSNLRGVHQFRYPYSRFYCDVERLVDDEMESQGQGIAYEYYDSLHRRLDSATKDNVYKSRAAYLGQLTEALNDCPNPLLIDCHSFTPVSGDDVDVCIGFNDDWSMPDEERLLQVRRHFEGCGYKVAFNYPYSNSLTPESDKKYSSLMIEVNKSAYLAEDGFCTEGLGFNAFRCAVNDLYGMLMAG